MSEPRQQISFNLAQQSAMPTWFHHEKQSFVCGFKINLLRSCSKMGEKEVKITAATTDNKWCSWFNLWITAQSLQRIYECLIYQATNWVAKLNFLVNGGKNIKQPYDMHFAVPDIATRNKEGDFRKLHWYKKCNSQLWDLIESCMKYKWLLLKLHDKKRILYDMRKRMIQKE